MGAKRKILVVLLVMAVAPGIFVCSELPEPDYTSPVFIERLEVAPARSGPLTLDAAWVLSSENDHFGGRVTGRHGKWRAGRPYAPLE